MIELFVDIDETLVYMGSDGDIKFPGVPGYYRLAHGALEFLVALDRIPQVRLSFYSAGASRRNRNLVQCFADQIQARFGHQLRKFDVFSVPPRNLGRKCLRSVKPDVDMENAVLVDDLGNVEEGQERNLLKLYEHLSDARGDDKMRLDNNLVRALGMLLFCMDEASAEGSTLVAALHKLQRDAEGRYLHGESNSAEIYDRGLGAMQLVNPAFALLS